MNETTQGPTIGEQAVASWTASDFDLLFERYTAQTNLAEQLEQMLPTAYGDAIGQALAAARELEIGFQHAVSLGDGAHRAAVQERLENLDAILDPYILAAERIRALRSLAMLAVEAKAEALQLGREVDAAMDRKGETLTERARALGWAPRNDDQE